MTNLTFPVNNSIDDYWYESDSESYGIYGTPFEAQNPEDILIQLEEAEAKYGELNIEDFT